MEYYDYYTYSDIITNDNITKKEVFETIPEFTFDTKYNQEKIYIKLDKKEYWFMMGYYVRNGWIQSESGHYIKFALQSREDEIIEIIDKVLPITYKMCSTGKCTEIGSYNNFPRICSINYTWYSILKDFGKNKSGKMIPEWVYNASKEYIQEFINGFQKSDKEMITDSFDIAFGMQRLYVKLNKMYSITITPKKTEEGIKFSLYIHNQITII